MLMLANVYAWTVPHSDTRIAAVWCGPYAVVTLCV